MLSLLAAISALALAFPLILNGGHFVQSVQAWDFCFIGDPTSIKIRDSMKAESCGVNVLGGDYYGKYKEFVTGFKENPSVPVLAANGNHDECSKVAKADNIKGDKCQYSFVWKNVYFINVNTEKKIGDVKKFIEGAMKKAQGMNSIDHIVVFEHKPAVTNPTAHHSEKETKGYKAFYVDMGLKYPKFRLALSGHNHNYLECQPIGSDVKFITDGTANIAKPYPIGTSLDDSCHNGLSGVQYGGYSIIEVGGPGNIISHHISVGK